MKSPKRKYAQERTAYIVYNNPKGAAKLLYSKGYEPPKKIEELLGAVKELSRRQGEKFQKELLLIHPERELILNLSKEKTQNEKQGAEDEDENYSSFCACGGACGGAESSFCGCGGGVSSFSGDEEIQLEKLSDEDLDVYYRNALNASKSKPADKTISAQVQNAFAEKQVRAGRANKNTNSKNENTTAPIFLHLQKMMTIENAIGAGVILVIGVLIGRGLRAD